MPNENITIIQTALRSLPFGKFGGYRKMQDMNGDERMALVWMSHDKLDPLEIRRSYFCPITGNYLGEV